MAISELEALVGHLFVVSGRSISSASPGSVAMPAPRKAARGRDADTFFGLVGFGGSQREQASTYEEAIHGVAESYFSSAGSVTSALRDAITSLNTSLRSKNGSRDEALTVGLACAILREQELTIAVAGPARCFLIREDFVERLPTDEEMEDGTPPLGLEQDADVRFYRREVRSGDFLILADASLNHLKNIAVRHAVESGEVDASVINLRSVSGDFAAAEVIKFVTPLAEGELDPTPAPRRLPMVPPMPELGGAREVAKEPVRDSVAVSDAPREAPAAVMTPANEAAPPVMDMSSAVVAPSLDEQPEPMRKKALPFFRKAGRDSAMGAAKATSRTRTLVERMMPDNEVDNPLSQRLQLSTTMQVSVALAIAILVALFTVAIYKLRESGSEYAALKRNAEAELALARAAGSDQAAARPHYDNVIFILDQADAIRDPSAEVWALRTEAMRALDSFDWVTRVEPMLLREYELGAQLESIVVQGIDVYTIDTTGDILYREGLNEDGTQLVNGEPEIIARKGEIVGNQVVGGLIDIAWVVESGLPQSNVLAVLSRDNAGNGLMITYSPSLGVSSVIMPSSQAWNTPRAIAFYNRDLYILDSGANEIWRYVAEPSGYTSQPQRYFTDIDPGLGDALDIAIDTNGNVFVLHASGRISKFFFGKPEAFELKALPQPVSFPKGLYLKLSPFESLFFIANAGNIYTTTPAGDFRQNYRDTDDTVFDNVSSVYNLEGPHVYFTAGNRLYYFARP